MSLTIFYFFDVHDLEDNSRSTNNEGCPYRVPIGNNSLGCYEDF